MTISETIFSLLLTAGVNPGHLVSGLAGAIVRTIMAKTNSLTETFTGGFVGTACAVYLTPLVFRYFSFDPTDLALNNGIAFGIGLAGVYLAEGLVRMLQRWANNPKLPKTADLNGIADAVNPEQPKDTPK